jgi:predicted hotdog family 3-hydroxylacyl-ACP dehydratase
MQMITKLAEADERSARGELAVTPDNIFCEQGFLRESGMVEFIAQTAAAFTGFRNKLQNRAITEGYIGAVKNLTVYGLPPVGSEISCNLTLDNEIVGFTIILGKVTLNDQVLAECEMRIVG